MSNQVYSNDRTKYYDYPGLNSYFIPAQVPVANGATEDLSFTNPIIVNDPTMIDNSGFNTHILRDGMYSFMVNLDLQSAASPATTNMEGIFSILCDRPGQFTGLVLQRVRTTYIPLSGNISAEQILALSATLYLKQNDLVYFRFLNITGAVINILTLNTILTVNKIY